VPIAHRRGRGGVRHRVHRKGDTISVSSAPLRIQVPTSWVATL
jgi:hypothetical protein